MFHNLKLVIGLTTVVLAVTASVADAQQVTIQSGSASARAEGSNNWAVGKIQQSSRQRTNLGNRANTQQTIQQHGTVDSFTQGQNNTVVGNINQSAQQKSPHDNQTAIQNASGNYRAIGNNNVVDGKIDQVSNQGQ